MSVDSFAALFSGLALLVTILGWRFTYLKQEKLESIKGDILKIVSEHDIRFEHFHRRRVEVNEDLYSRITKIIALLTSSVKGATFVGEISPEEYRSRAIKQFFEIMSFYDEKRLYVNKGIREQIELFNKNVINISSNFGTLSQLQQFLSTGFDSQMDEQRITIYQQTVEIIRKDLPPLRDLIEKQMQEILEGQ